MVTQQSIDISVILPCYNGSRWISQAIASVLKQTHRNFELLIIDDGSTDNSKTIIANYQNDERLRYIYQKNRGFSGAINRGIIESRGSFIAFIGQDDLWLPSKLAKQMEYLNRNRDISLLHSNFGAIDAQGNFKSIRRIKQPTQDSNYIKRLFLKNFLGFETVILRRTCFEKDGLFDEAMTGFSDHDMWLRLAGSHKFEYVDDILVLKREHESQISTSKLEKVVNDEFLLSKKAVTRYPYLSKQVRKKLASLYYSLGIYFLENGDYAKCRVEIVNSIICKPNNLKSIIVYISPKIYNLALSNYLKTSRNVRSNIKFLES